MPQIPVFNPSQRVEPGSPVSAISPEGTAGNLQGNATEGFGKAMFILGNELDKLSKITQAKQDELAIRIAVNQANDLMMREKAKQDAKGVKLDETPDGLSAVDNFQNAVNPELDKIAAQLPERLRAAFQGSVGDDYNKYKTSVLAGELDKREKTIPLMEQDFIGGLAALSRKDLKSSVTAFSQIEEYYTLSDQYADKDKPFLIKKGQQQVAKEAIAGILDDAKLGSFEQSSAAFNKAKEVLRKGFNDAFDADELEKELKQIESVESSYYNKYFQLSEANIRKQQQDLEIKKRQKLDGYIKKLQEAGNDQTKYNAVQIELAADPLMGEAETKKLQTNAFMEVPDSNYASGIYTQVLKKTKNINSLIDQVNSDYILNKVSAPKREQIIKYLENLRDQTGRDPTISRLMSDAEDEIKSYGTYSVFDINGIDKPTNDKFNAAAVTQFSVGLANLSANGQLNASSIVSLKDKIIKDYYGGKAFPNEGSKGIPPTDVDSIEKVDKKIKEAGKIILSPSYKTLPNEQKKKLIEDLKYYRSQKINLEKQQRATSKKDGE